MNLVLFDFDGTLTDKDSLGEFLKYSVDRKTYLLKMFRFLPDFILYKLKLVRNDISKQKLFALFYTGMDEAEFKKTALEYSLKEIDKIIRKERFELLKEHQKNGERVIIVSASMKCWLKPWCDKNNIELLSTELEFKDNRFTGKFLTPNCYGDEKANRIKKHLNIKDYTTIYAYGDSAGDDAMLSLADKAIRY